jgi:acetate kinase
LALDPSRNSAARGLISADTSRVKALVVPTDEERMIARYTARTLGI